MSGDALLSVRDLRTYLATRHGVVRAVDGVSLEVREAEVLGVVGESGCGKSGTCKTIMGLMTRTGTTHRSRRAAGPRRAARWRPTPARTGPPNCSPGMSQGTWSGACGTTRYG